MLQHSALYYFLQLSCLRSGALPSWLLVNVVFLIMMGQISSRELEEKATTSQRRSWSLTYSPGILLAPFSSSQGGAGGWALDVPGYDIFEGFSSWCWGLLDLPLRYVEKRRVNFELQVLKKRGNTTRFPTSMPAANSPALGDRSQRLCPYTKVKFFE